MQFQEIPWIRLHTKGQLISKCLYEVIVWTKIPTKKLIISVLGQGRNYQKFR